MDEHLQQLKVTPMIHIRKTSHDLLAIMLAALAGSHVFATAAETNANNAQSPANNTASTRVAWPSVGNYEGGISTNGLFCRLEIGSGPDGSNRKLPLCRVWVANTSINSFLKCWKACPTNYLSIELFDSGGKPVEKSAAGRHYGASPNVKQLMELRKTLTSAKLSGRGGPRTIYVQIPPSSPGWEFASFSIAELFELKQAGEYSMRVQMRLIREPSKDQFTFTPLPEVIAKIQIRAADIVGRHAPLGQTNSPSE